MKYLFVLLLYIFMLSSCSEDPSASDPYLEITPENLTGVTFTYYPFRAILHNFASNDIIYEWYFGIGDTITADRYDQISYAFDKPGNYTLSVTAYDIYTDKFLAKKQVPITITSIQPQVLITPTTNDTSIYQDVDGTLQNFGFIANTNVALDRAVFYWHATPNLRDDTFEYYHFNGYKFPNPDRYQISVNMYDPSGNFLARDTTSINIKKKEITQEMLSNTNSIVIVFCSTPTLQDSLNYLPSITSGVLKHRNLTTNYSINGTQLLCSTIDSSVYPPTNRWQNVELTGTFSNDLSRIDNLHVHETDTMKYDTYAEPLYDISYDLKNISLLSVTPYYLIYYAHNIPTSGFAENVKITKLTTADDTKYNTYGQVYDYLWLNLQVRELVENETEYALIIFKRNEQ